MGNGRWGGWLGGVGVVVAAFGLLPGSGFAFGSAAASLLPQIEIVVDNATDDVNGDVSTVTALLANPGPDGISLREAIDATNADPGSYKVVFAASMAGSTIATIGFDLLGGGVHVNGDIDGDTQPDVTVAAAGPPAFLSIQSSNNTVSAIEFSGVGVTLRAEQIGASFDGITVAGNKFRNVRQAIVAHPPGDLVTERNNTWTNTRIIDNDIEATQSAIDLMSHFTVGDTFDRLEIVGNRVHIPEPDGDAFGIHLSSGYWHGSTDNTFTNVLIANNIITGKIAWPILLGTGGVGSDGNRIDGVQILDNTIATVAKQSVDGSGTEASIFLVAADSGTDYEDPGYIPVQYPDDNAITNVEIAGNTIDGFAWAGIAVIPGGFSGTGNEVAGVEIRDNTITGFLPNWVPSIAGIHLWGGAGVLTREVSDQAISDVLISENTVVITANPEVLQPYQTLSSGGILIIGGDHWSSRLTVSDIVIERNQVDSLVPGINIIGGFGEMGEAVGNTVANVDVLCNQLDRSPTHLLTSYPGLKGINLAGGAGDGARGNTVNNIRIGRNDVAGVWNDVSASPDMNSATGNSIDWLIDDSLAPECPLRRDWFIDDDSSVFEADIEWLAAEGITRGCNPPVNDMFCPNKPVTRGQMAAFLHRALDGIVEPSGDPIDFTDDDDSAFVADIAWLSATGITKGCTATEYCPNKAVTRGQMAAFLVRAMGYSDDGGGDLFTDDDDSVFRFDIDKLATAGVTLGCNPPVNDQYCPGKAVTRGQMAAFLHRSLG